MASAAEEVGVAHIVGVALGGNGATDAPSQQPVEAHVGALVGAVAEQLTGAVMAAAGPLAAASTAAASASMAVEPTSEDLEADHAESVGDGLIVAEGPLPIEPCSGTLEGGFQIRWVGGAPAPDQLFIGQRPCATVDGAYVVPFADSSAYHDVTVVAADGAKCRYLDAFAYFEPGELRDIRPPRAPMAGGIEVTVTTSDMGADIVQVFLGGVSCELLDATVSTATVMIPDIGLEGPVQVEVLAKNSNSAKSAPDAFILHAPEVFSTRFGDNIDLSDDLRRATRTQKVTGGVVLGGTPLRRVLGGRYFEVVVTEWQKAIRTMAVGVTVEHGDELLTKSRRLRAEEAKAIDRVWLIGYEKGGAFFVNDKQEEKISVKAWRPAQDVKEGSRIGVLWTEPEPGLVIFQDGQERVRLAASGRIPSSSDDLFAVVDVQGAVRAVELVEGAVPPIRDEIGEMCD